MPYENISASLTLEAIKSINDSLSVIRKNLSFVINLTAEERGTLLKMGDKSLPFVTKALEYAKDNKSLVPPYINIAEMEKDFVLAQSLIKINNQLNSISEAVNDTTMAVGSEAFLTAIGFYQSVKQASKMNVPGTTSIYEDLKERFPGAGTNAGSDSQNSGVIAAPTATSSN